VSYFSDTARNSLRHGGVPDRGDMERRLNRFLLHYADSIESVRPDKADRVRRETIPRWPLPET
jgi:hypothetical protein